MYESSNPFGAIKIISAQSISIFKNAAGILKGKFKDANEECTVKPIRCFPLTGADHYVGLYKTDDNGKLNEELLLVSSLERLDDNSRNLIKEELDKSYSLTWITEIYSAKQINEELRLRVDTEAGERTLDVKNPDQNIYMIPPSLLVIKDAEGNRFLADSSKLDPKSTTFVELYI